MVSGNNRESSLGLCASEESIIGIFCEHIFFRTEIPGNSGTLQDGFHLLDRDVAPAGNLARMEGYSREEAVEPGPRDA